MQLDPLLFDAQSVSTIMHSLAKLEWRDQKLFRKLATVVGQMEFILEPQSIALIINACAKVEYHDMKLMKHISRIACSLPADTFTPQHVENVLNGFARLEVRERREQLAREPDVEITQQRLEIVRRDESGVRLVGLAEGAHERRRALLELHLDEGGDLGGGHCGRGGGGGRWLALFHVERVLLW